MAGQSVIVTLFLAFLGVVLADQICIRTKSKWIGFGDNYNSWTRQGGTDCALRVKAYVNNYGWKYGFIDKHSNSNWKSTEFGQAYVSRQRVHEHTDTCFEMQSGFATVNLDEDITVSFVDENCNDAMWIDRFFIPGRNKAWGQLNTQGWCMNGKKNLDGGKWFEDFDNAANKVYFNTGCARQLKLKTNGQVSVPRWGSTSGTGNRGHRFLREVQAVQDIRFMGLEQSERREITLIEALYDVCESSDLGENFDSADRYNSETQQIVSRCYEMLTPFQKTYEEFQDKEEKTIPTDGRSATSDLAEHHSEDLETSESERLNRLMSTIRSLP